MLDILVYSVARSVTGLIPHRIVDNGQRVESDVDDNVTLVVQRAGGQQEVLRSLWGTSFVRFNDTAIYGRQGTLWFDGENLIIHSPKRAIKGAESVTSNGRKDCYRVPAKLLQNVTGEGLIDHFADCINGRAQPMCGGKQALHVHQILFKGYEGARTGLAQQLETTFKPWHPIAPSFCNTRSHFI